MEIPKIKICGLMGIEDAQILNRNQVEYAGIVLFYPKSKRNQEIDKSKEILTALSAGIKKVAVTVSPTIEQVQLIEEAGFDILQVHGELYDEVVEGTSLDIFRAFNMENTTLLSDSNYDKIKGYVFDGKVPGNGEVFDWSLIRGFDRKEKMLILAGGLTSENLSRGIEYLNPDIVDVSSGVENMTGIGKDEEKVKVFVEVARNSSHV